MPSQQAWIQQGKAVHTDQRFATDAQMRPTNQGVSGWDVKQGGAEKLQILLSPDHSFHEVR